MTTSRHLRWLCTILMVAIALGVCAAGRVNAGTNPDFRIVLHAKPSSFEPCNGYLPVDCISNPPTVNLPSTAPIAVFVLLFNYTAASGIQTAFQWPGWSPTFFSLGLPAGVRLRPLFHHHSDRLPGSSRATSSPAA